MKIAVVGTRHMFMSPARATSIDLCIHDFVRFSGHAGTTRVFVRPVEDPFTDLDLAFVDGGNYRAVARQAADAIRGFEADLVVVHQHLPTAALIARQLAPLPVLYHGHNFEKRPKGFVQRWRHRRRYRRLAGLIFVSETCRDAFLADWPGVAAPSHVVHNGLDFSLWHPAAEREKTVFYAGRLEPSKGVLEAAEALTAVLPGYPDWRAEFLLVAKDNMPEFRDRVFTELGKLGDRVTLRFDRPHEEVRKRLERVAIALTPSKSEPFGRAALEAHAGGAALVSSGVDGLGHVSGGTALYPTEQTAKGYAATIERMIRDPDFRENLAVRARQRAEAEFDIRRSAAKLDAIYRDTLAATTGSGSPQRTGT